MMHPPSSRYLHVWADEPSDLLIVSTLEPDTARICIFFIQKDSIYKSTHESQETNAQSDWISLVGVFVAR